MSVNAHDVNVTPATVCRLIVVAIGAGFENVREARDPETGAVNFAAATILRGGEWYRVSVSRFTPEGDE